MKQIQFAMQMPIMLVASVLSLQTIGGVLTVGPDYQPPTNQSPAVYKAAELGAWKEGRPLDHLPKGNWWGLFGDAALNQLEAQAAESNQDLRAALARVEQSRAVARVARGALLPTLSADPSFSRKAFSQNSVPNFGKLTANTLSTPLDLSYEVDLWGRVRRGFESARAEAQASVAGFQTALLTLQADVAENYYALRAVDAEIDLVRRTVNLRQESVRLVRLRFTNGLGNELEVAQAETELATAEAEAASLAKRRDELENAIAILVGANPSMFKLAALTTANWNLEPPGVPAGLPAELLERRPDVAQAERQLASANAKIGIAKAAFFPVITLTGSGGFLSADADSLFNWSSRTWSLGPSVSLPLFAGGRNRANYRRAQAAFEESVAQYRQHVLVAFGEVENTLAALHHLADRAAAQDRAVTNSRRAAELANERYLAGITGYLEVVDADRQALSAERGRTELTGQRLVTTIQLIKALGGGWTNDLLLSTTSAQAK